MKPIHAAIPSGDDAIPRVSQLLDRVGRVFGLPPEVLTDLRIALDEIVSNIVKYAYAEDAPGNITIQCEVRDGCLQTTVEDGGVAFDPLLVSEPDLAVPLESRRVGGLGVHFVKNLMNGVAYERVGGRNRLILKQDLRPAGDKA